MLKFGKFGLLSAPIGFGSYYLYKNRSVQSANEYTYDEIQKHNKESDVWVTYKNNVYDIYTCILKVYLRRIFSV